MDVAVDTNGVAITLTHEEAIRLAVALQEGVGHDVPSRAEYWIRTGLSKPEVQQLARDLYRLAKEHGRELLRLEPGVETVENPRRPRPPRQDS